MTFQQISFIERSLARSKDAASHTPFAETIAEVIISLNKILVCLSDVSVQTELRTPATFVWQQMLAYLKDKVELTSAAAPWIRAILEAEFPRLLGGWHDVLAFDIA